MALTTVAHRVLLSRTAMAGERYDPGWTAILELFAKAAR
jgi:hypothetical protein